MAICKLFDECCCRRCPADYFDWRRFLVVFAVFLPPNLFRADFPPFPDTFATHMLFSLSDESFLRHQRLHVWRKVGEGSFSKVYVSQFKATTPNTPTTTPNNKPLRLIATKVINKNRVSAKFVEKFLPRELDVLLKLRHPFLVQASTTRRNRDPIPAGDLRGEKNKKDRKKDEYSVHVEPSRFNDLIPVRSDSHLNLEVSKTPVSKLSGPRVFFINFI